MRRAQRLIAGTVLIALCGVLGGCAGGLSNFDPSDLLDFLDTKKKLPGERKPVFPDGVPGLEQGVPKELYKSEVDKQQQEQDQAAAAATAAPPPAPPVEEPKGKKHKKGRAAAAAEPGGRACGWRDPGRRAGRRRRAAGTQAQEDRAPAHHRAAARRCQPGRPGASSSNRAVSRLRCRAAASAVKTIPG